MAYSVVETERGAVNPSHIANADLRKVKAKIPRESCEKKTGNSLKRRGSIIVQQSKRERTT